MCGVCAVNMLCCFSIGFNKKDAMMYFINRTIPVGHFQLELCVDSPIWAARQQGRIYGGGRTGPNPLQKAINK